MCQWLFVGLDRGFIPVLFWGLEVLRVLKAPLCDGVCGSSTLCCR